MSFMFKTKYYSIIYLDHIPQYHSSLHACEGCVYILSIAEDFSVGLSNKEEDVCAMWLLHFYFL